MPEGDRDRRAVALGAAAAILWVVLALRWGLGRLPQGVRRTHVLAAGAVAGIPFTVSLFVAELALPPRLVEPATVAIILAAVATGLVGFLLVRRTGGRSEPPRDPVPPQVS